MTEQSQCGDKSELDGIVKLMLPVGMIRMESGPVQFGDDWPGIYLRGDNAMGIAIFLDAITDVLPKLDPISAIRLRETARLLRSCNTNQAKRELTP